MGARRKPGARWSAAFSTKRRTAGSALTAFAEGPEATDDELRKALWGADRISFHWRYDRRSATRAFALPAGLDDAIAFRRLLTASIVADLPADDRGHPPEAGAGQTSATPELPASDNVVELTPRPTTPTGTTRGPIASVARIGSAPQVAETAPPSGLAGLRAQVASTTWDHMSREVTPLENFDALAVWQMADLQASASKRHTPRAGSTLGGYEGDLDLASRFFRYLPGDARLADRSIGAHESMRLNRSDGIGLTTEDCIGFVEHRKTMNLRTRTANLRAEQKWGRAVEAAERAAAYPGAPVDLPPAPISKPETTLPATVKSACGTIKTAFASAVAEGRLDADPWTARVDKLIVSAPPTHFTDKQLWSPDQVDAIATAMAAHERRGTYRNGVAQTLDGGRYRGMIELGYHAYLRPEEVIAARLDWAALDGPNPFIIIHGAEVNYPLRFTGADTARQYVSLKARNAGDTRLVPLTTEDAAALRRHIETHVAEPDPTSADPDRQNPRLFTTHSGAPIDLGAFSDKWLIPVLATVFPAPGQANLRALRFRHLRHSGITALLRAGEHYEDVATWAGNSPLVIKTSYRGVIDQTGAATRPRSPHGTALAETFGQIAGDVFNLAPADAAQRIEEALPDLTPEAAYTLGKALAHSGRTRMAEVEI